ncbi:Hypothetical predicted protein [Octopus vulgaris]|uniref:Reverse transcriptase domain-containing protein n=1 Tax=Octopus vulgaris TaxID=6645 RepID=A0AA36AMF5_OCTVU|nr:Hypothetical predicted protein [Octopus vulgaris]
MKKFNNINIVRALQDSHSAPELKVALVVLEQKKYNIDITALNETRLAGSSQLEEGRVQQDFKDGSIQHLYKNKGNRSVCDNHRGISLLSVAGKKLARLLDSIIKHVVNNIYPESQCRFFSGRDTIDMIFPFDRS